MAAPVKTFENNNPPQCTAEDLNAYKDEINNAISGLGISLNASDYSQLIEAVLKAATTATFYTYSGTANGVILTRVGSRDATPTYYDGMRVSFIATTVNTGPATINVDGLGIKNIKRRNGDDLSPQDISGFTEVIYSAADDYFIITTTADISQFAAYDPIRVYTAGEVVYTVDGITGELSFWQWYSNLESLAGKDPLDTANRHEGWSSTTAPFYWIPYKGNITGMPFFWLDTDAPEWAVMEINVNLPTAVYWRLADRFPDLVFDDGGTLVINTGEIRGEYLRVLDQGRGVDPGRAINSAQAASGGGGGLAQLRTAPDNTDLRRIVDVPADGTWSAYTSTGRSTPYTVSVAARNPTPGGSGGELNVRNVARPMAIAI